MELSSLKMQKLRQSLILALLGLSLSCSSLSAREYLSRKDAFVLVSDDLSTEESKRIRVEVSASGCLQDFGPMKSKLKNDTLILMIPVTGLISCLKKKTLRQSLDLLIEIPKGTKRVTMAGDGCEIWPRDLGAHVYPPEEQKALEIAIKQYQTDFNRTNMSRVGTSVSETHLRLTNNLGYRVVISAHDTNTRTYYYLSRPDLTIIERIDQ